MKQSGSLTAERGRAPSFMTLVLDAIGARVGYGTLEIETPNGEMRIFRGAQAPEQTVRWRLHNWKPLWSVATRGALGLGESYLDGDWDSPDLPAFLYFASVNEPHFGSTAAGLGLLRYGDRLRHWLHRNTPRRARRNIAYHYDLGNDFYRLVLDPSMTYSAALFEHGDETLEQAQRAKYARLAELVELGAEDRVLEIGCGWGGFMAYAAAERGAEVTGVSISEAQCVYARERLAAAGLEARTAVELRDYRELRGQFRHIVSIEMFEAVGEAYWDTYAEQLKRLLAPGGKAALQLITIDHARFEGYRRSPDFIQRYVFPGGMLPSFEVLEATLARAGLAITDRLDFGLDYARTLVAWRERFEAAWPAIAAQGFDQRFKRLWLFYLAYCEAGFLHRAIDVVQVRVEHQA